MLNPERTLAIVCGAQKWPDLETYEDAAAFAKSANLIRGYLAGKKGLGLPKEHVLWLFDKPNAVTQYLSITAFLQRQLAVLSAPRGKGVLILFFYIGHGAFFPPSSSRIYCLLVKDTRKLFEDQTSLQVATLAKLFRKHAAESQRILFLDCCFAGEAAKLFQAELDQVVSAKANEVVEEDPADRGVALLCASSARNPAKVESLTTYTYFSHELIQVLTKGDPDISRPLTLRRLCRLIRRGLRSAAGDDAPNPEVHVPDQARGDLADVPLFPNPAWRGPATSKREDAQIGHLPRRKPRNIDAPRTKPSKDAQAQTPLSDPTVADLDSPETANGERRSHQDPDLTAGPQRRLAVRHEKHESNRLSNRMTRPSIRSAADRSPVHKISKITTGHGSKIPSYLILPDLRPILNTVAQELSDSSQIDAIVAMTGLDNAQLPASPADGRWRWIAVFKAALEELPETLAALLSNISDSFDDQSKGTLERALRETGLSYMSRITRAVHPDLEDSADKLLCATGGPEMNAAAKRVRQTAINVRRLLTNTLLTDAYALQLSPAILDPEHWRIELANHAAEVVDATDYLLRMLSSPATASPRLVLASDRGHGPGDEEFDRLIRRRLDARGAAVQAAMRLISELGYGSATPSHLSLSDLRPILKAVAQALSDSSQIDAIVAMTGLDNVQLPASPANTMERWKSVFYAALEEPPETLAVLLRNIGDSLDNQSRNALERALRETGFSRTSLIGRPAHPELGDEAEELLSATSESEMNAAAQKMRQTGISVWRLLVNPLVIAYLQLAPFVPDLENLENQRIELANLTTGVVNATDYLLSMLSNSAAATSPPLVLEREFASDRQYGPGDEEFDRLIRRRLDARGTAVRAGERLLQALRSDVVNWLLINPADGRLPWISG